MPFPYYDRLGPRRQAIYRQSDRVTEIRLPRPEALRPFVDTLREALARDDRRAVEAAAQCICRGIAGLLGVAPAEVEVRAVRPRSSGGELHGLYTAEDGAPARIRLWMRTAQHRRVVAFRTFLRTLLHEVGHHLDYRYLKLGDSLHTEGFFRRESSLVRQLLAEGVGEAGASAPATRERGAPPDTGGSAR